MNKDEVLNVDKEMIVSWMEEGMVQIPSVLLNKYKQIGLDEKELVLLLHIQFFMDRETSFQHPSNCVNGCPALRMSALRCWGNSSKCSSLP